MYSRIIVIRKYLFYELCVLFYVFSLVEGRGLDKSNSKLSYCVHPTTINNEMSYCVHRTTTSNNKIQSWGLYICFYGVRVSKECLRMSVSDMCRTRSISHGEPPCFLGTNPLDHGIAAVLSTRS